VTSALIRVSLLVRVSKFKVLRVVLDTRTSTLCVQDLVPKGKWSQIRRGHKVLKG
jgi:hypothetical protein